MVVADSIIPARTLESLRSILMVEVCSTFAMVANFACLALPKRKKEQTLLLHHLAWQLPAQPRHEFTAIRSPNHVVQTKPFPENPCPENQLLVLTAAFKLRNPVLGLLPFAGFGGAEDRLDYGHVSD